jgi:hypothetical protein
VSGEGSRLRPSSPQESVRVEKVAELSQKLLNAERLLEKALSAPERGGGSSAEVTGGERDADLGMPALDLIPGDPRPRTTRAPRGEGDPTEAVRLK